MFVAYMIANVMQMKKAPAEQPAGEEKLMSLPKTRILLIALTCVALGTSLPELVTAITALV